VSRLRDVLFGCAVYVSLDIGAAQVLKHTRVWYPDAAERPYRKSVSPYHHGLAENVNLMGQWGSIQYPVRTNSLGFRDAEVRTIPLRAAGPRVVLIGDSFTEGLGVPYADTYAGLLDHCLGRSGLQVLNAGVMSYSPSIYYRKLKYLLEDIRLQIDYVVVAIDISDIRDEAERYQLDSLGNVVDRPSQARRSLLKENSLLLHVAVLVRDAARARWADPARYTDWTGDSRAYDEHGAKGLALAAARMDQLLSILRERHIGVAVIVYPYPNEILRNDSNSVQVRFWGNWTATRGVPFFNLFPVFMRSSPAAAVLAKRLHPPRRPLERARPPLGRRNSSGSGLGRHHQNAAFSS
jgi:lysophospholipase L1-like esterase